MKSLNHDDRRFLQMVADTMFVNPFSIDARRIAAVPGLDAIAAVPPGLHAFEVLTPVIESRLRSLAAAGIERVDQLGDTDRQLVEFAHLFLAFDRYRPAMDELIKDQLLAGKEPIVADYAQRLGSDLAALGFAEAHIATHAALLFQMRRAYYFIAEALVGASAPMRELRHALWNNVFTVDVRTYAHHLIDRMEDFSLLLLGETGTGKGAAAAAIGRAGYIPYDPARRRFVASFAASFHAINLSEFPESLIESELFGHRKGAFTGAIDNHEGILARCHRHGALLIDEIGDVSESIQIKLLNVLQHRSYARVGDHAPQRFEGRVIAATNRNLEELMQSGRFRPDFYYRLSSDVIRVPTLRDRLRAHRKELAELVTLLVARMAGSPQTALVDQVLGVFERDLPRDYAWPGNVRELEQAVRRVVISGTYQGQRANSESRAVWLDAAAQGSLSADELLAHYCQALYAQSASYADVAARTGLDRRTAKKYIQGPVAKPPAGQSRPP